MPFISFLPHIGITVFDYGSDDVSGGIVTSGPLRTPRRSYVWWTHKVFAELSSLTKAYPVSGGLTTGGTAPKSLTKVYAPATNGVTTGGVADTDYLVPGRIDVRGTAPYSLTHAYSVSGGITTGGTAPKRLIRVYTVSGGLTTGGTAPKSLTKVYAVSGGLITSGSGSFVVVHIYTVLGGLQTNGTSPTSLTKAYATLGGLTLSGIASTSFGTEYVYASSGAVLTGGNASTELSYASVGAPSGAGLIARSQLYQFIHDAYNLPKKIFTYVSRGSVSLQGSSTVTLFSNTTPPRRMYVSVPVHSGIVLGTVSASTELTPAVFKPLRTIYLVHGRGTITIRGDSGAEASGVPVDIDGYPDLVQPFLTYWDPQASSSGVRAYGEAQHLYVDRLQQIIEQEDEELLLGLLT